MLKPILITGRKRRRINLLLLAGVYSITMAAKRIYDKLSSEDPNSISGKTDMEIGRMIRDNLDKYYESVDVAQMRLDGKYASRKIQATIEELRRIDAEKKNSPLKRIGSLFNSEVDRNKMYEVHKQNPLTITGKAVSAAKGLGSWISDSAQKISYGAGRVASNQMSLHMNNTVSIMVAKLAEIAVTSALKAMKMPSDMIGDYKNALAHSSYGVSSFGPRGSLQLIQQKSEILFVNHARKLMNDRDPAKSSEGRAILEYYKNSPIEVQDLMLKDIQYKISQHSKNPTNSVNLFTRNEYSRGQGQPSRGY